MKTRFVDANSIEYVEMQSSNEDLTKPVSVDFLRVSYISSTDELKLIETLIAGLSLSTGTSKTVTLLSL